MKDAGSLAAYVLVLGVIHFAANQFTENTAPGRRIRDYLRNWKTDSLSHLVLCAGTVIIFLWCGILALVLILDS